MQPRTATTRIGAGLSTAPAAADAGREAARVAARTLDGRPADLAFLFLSAPHLEHAASAAAAARDELDPRCLVGCVSEGVVAGPRELQEGTAAAVWAASLPHAEIEPFHVVGLDDGVGTVFSGAPELADPSLVAILADPYSFPVGAFLAELNDERPELPLVGGIAVGGSAPGAQALIVDDEVHGDGAVGVALGGIAVRTVVSQGCSAIGREAVITSAEENVVHELAGTPALEWVKAQLASLPPERQQLAAQGLLAGLVIDENKAEYGRGDYLMRGLIGIDQESGAIAIGERVRVGQTLRLHVRDAASADDDLREALDHALRGVDAAGALLFTCNGRGRHMFPQPDHDSGLVAAALGSDAVAGMFCGGEIGPVGGRAFLHGFTATIAVFPAA